MNEIQYGLKAGEKWERGQVALGQVPGGGGSVLRTRGGFHCSCDLEQVSPEKGPHRGVDNGWGWQMECGGQASEGGMWDSC